MEKPLDIIEVDCPYWYGIPEVDDDCRHWTQLSALQSPDAPTDCGGGSGAGNPAGGLDSKGNPGT
jgi:hypothetical protein